MCYEITWSSVYTVPATSEITGSGQPWCTVCTTKSCSTSCIMPQEGLCHKLSATRVPCHKLVQSVPQAGPQSTLWSQLPLLGDHSFKLTSKTSRGILCHPIVRQLFWGLHVVMRSTKCPINDMQMMIKSAIA